MQLFMNFFLLLFTLNMYCGNLDTFFFINFQKNPQQAQFIPYLVSAAYSRLGIHTIYWRTLRHVNL